MSVISSPPIRHHFLPAPAATFMLLTPDLGDAQTAQSPRMPADVQSIRPFHVHVPDSDLADLRRRIGATRWPDKETVTDSSQGAQLARLQELVRYWGGGYDWRKAESQLNALPQFTTNI